MTRTVSYGNVMEDAPRPRKDWKELACDQCGKSTGLAMNPKAEVRIRGRVFCKDCNGGQAFVGDWWVTLPEMTCPYNHDNLRYPHTGCTCHCGVCIKLKKGTVWNRLWRKISL